MARSLRIEYEGALYHVTARGNERGKIFFSRADYLKFLEYLAAARIKYDFIVHCYVLMTNHYHLLIETHHKNLSKIMHYLNSAYTTYINIKKKRNGHLFQGRYKSILVDRDNYLLELTRYMHLNPVRANMVNQPEEYRYSSYGAYICAVDEAVCTTVVLSMLSPDISEAKQKYRIFTESAMGEKTGSPLINLYGGMILGSPAFIKSTLQQIEDQLLHSHETSHRKALQANHLADDIMALICKRYDVSSEDVTSPTRNDLRKICIYLLKRHTVLTNRQIGEQLGGMSGFAVAKAYQRMVQNVKTDAVLKKEISWLESKMSCVKG